MRCVAPEGRIIPMGFASGTIPQIPANILLVKNVTVIGFYYGYYNGWGGKSAPTPKEADALARRRALVTDAQTELMRWFTEGKLKATVAGDLRPRRLGEGFPADRGAHRRRQGRAGPVMRELVSRCSFRHSSCMPVHGHLQAAPTRMLAVARDELISGASRRGTEPSTVPIAVSTTTPNDVGRH